MDPLTILPYEMREEIFSYFKFEDIINASSVCKNWYQATAKSKFCMSKIRFANPGMEIKQIDHILKSSRLYQHLILLVNDNHVKSNTTILRNMRSIINKFSGSVINLAVTHDLQRTFELPKLKTLAYFGHYMQTTRLIVPNGLHSKAKNLRKFIIKSISIRKPALKSLVNSFKQFTSLKSLMIDDCRILSILANEDLQFQLEELHVLKSNNFGMDNSLNNFINKFRSSLDYACGPFRSEAVVNLMTNFPKLESLIIRNQVLRAFNQHDELLQMQPNETIKVLVVNPAIIDLLNDVFYTNFRTILSKLGKLERLVISFVNERILDIISGCKSLQVVQYCIIEGISPLDLFLFGVLNSIVYIPISLAELDHQV